METYETTIGPTKHTFYKDVTNNMLDILLNNNINKNDSNTVLIEQLAKENGIKLERFQSIDIFSRYFFKKGKII